MIHQFIFTNPKPGMTVEEFQRYWVEVHAVKYASKIAQIKRYLIDATIPLGPAGEPPVFSGIAEIWLENEAEQLASLQTKEFLEGARRDEPNWAAFWTTVVLDTNTHVLLEGPPLSKDPTWVKFIVLMKRKAGMPLEEFRRYSLQVHGPLCLQLPGLRRYIQCHVRDSFYAVGESRFDAVSMFWFDSVAALEAALDSALAQEKLKADDALFLEQKYVFGMAAKEHWIIGPEFRR
jgi:uncharacterized protein (TIGR02118 family)